MTIDTDTFTLEYNDRTGDYEAAFHGLTVKAVRDQDASNPWKDTDGNVPMAYGDFDRRKPEVFDDGFDILNPFAHMSDGFIIRHQRALCGALEIDHAASADDVQSQMSDWGGNRAEYWRGLFRDVLGEFSYSVRLLEAIDRVYDLTKIPHYLGTTHGYSQGDQLSVLCVAFPEWCDKFGAPKDYTVDMFKGDVELLGAWAWGDVYGYVVEDDDGEQLDSCWGYYGTDFDKSGLMTEALSTARYEAKKRYAAKAGEVEEERPDLYEKV